MAEITIDYSLPDNSSDGDVEIYRSTSSGTLGTLVTTRAPSDPTEYTDTGLANATLYFYTIRRATDHATVDSAQDAQYTKPVAPTGFQVTAIDVDDISASWTDNASGEDGYRRLDSTDGGSSFSQIDGDLAADTSSATWSALSRPDTHTIKVRAFVGSGSSEATADSNTDERYLAPSRASTGGATWLVEVEHANGNVLRFRPSDGDFTPRLNGKPQFRATVGFDERWLSAGFDDATMRVWKNGQRLPIDTLIDRPTSPGETTLRGQGGSQLDRQAETSITQEAVHLTVEDLVDTKTDYVSNIDDPEAETTTNTLIQTADTQSEFKQIATAFPDDVPLYYPSGGGLISPAQTCFLFMNDGGDDAPSGLFSEENDGTLTTKNWEDADVIRLDSSNDYVEFDFNVEHRINEADIGVAWRRELDDAGGTLDMRVLLDGIELFDFDVGGGFPSPTWSPDYGDDYPVNLSPANNPHTLRFELGPTVASGAYVRLDVASVYDKRYHDVSNFPDDIITDQSDPGYLYLPGPAKFPDEVEVTTEDALPPISATGARLEVDVGGTYPAKRLEISGDQGQTYPLSADDVETLEGDFSGPVGQVRTRITLGAQGTGQTETPSDGYASPELLDYNLFADLNDTPLFIAENFQGSVEDVLVDGADYADAAWEVQWDDATQTQSIEWTQPGQRTAVSETPISDFSFSRTTEARRDRIRVTGRSVPIADESFNADHGTAVQLNNEPILTDSETVEDATTQYVQGQDYVVDWEAGTITTLSSGNIDDGDSLVISYRWQPLGVADRAGASAPYTVRKIALPALSTDRECEIAARRIRDATDEPLEEAEVTLTPDAIGLEAIDELQFTGLPTDRTLEVNEITDQAGSQVVSLGSRESVSGVVDDIRRKLSSTAENS